MSGIFVAMYWNLPSWPNAGWPCLATPSGVTDFERPEPDACPSTAQSFGGSVGERLGVDRQRFLRVREQVVAVDEHRVAPLVGEVERELHVLDAFAHVLGREHDVAVVAVTAAARRLVVVLLAARHVEDRRAAARRA